MNNSGSGSACDSTIYTYEAWVKRTGVGTDSGNGLVFAASGTQVVPVVAVAPAESITANTALTAAPQRIRCFQTAETPAP